MFAVLHWTSFGFLSCSSQDPAVDWWTMPKQLWNKYKMQTQGGKKSRLARTQSSNNNRILQDTIGFLLKVVVLRKTLQCLWGQIAIYTSSLALARTMRDLLVCVWRIVYAGSFAESLVFEGQKRALGCTSLVQLAPFVWALGMAGQGSTNGQHSPAQIDMFFDPHCWAFQRPYWFPEVHELLRLARFSPLSSMENTGIVLGQSQSLPHGDKLVLFSLLLHIYAIQPQMEVT